MLELNRVFWEYDNGDWWRSFPYETAKVSCPRYKRYGPTIRHDLFTLVEKFVEKYPNHNYYIAMSGGIDSEITAETFFQLGVPFEAISLSLFDAKNAFDLINSLLFFAYSSDNNPLIGAL